MDATNPSQAGAKPASRITLTHVLAWIFGILFLLAAVSALVGGAFISLIAYALAGFLIFPPLYANTFGKKVSLSRGLRATAAVILAIVAGVAMLSDTPREPKVVEGTSGGTETAAAKPADEPAIQVTAAKLYADYEANEVGADQKYKGKVVEVSGLIDSIGKDILDTPFVALSNGQQYSVFNVQCMFAKDDEAKLSGLVKGRSITLRGEVSGKLGGVIVRGCSIKE